MASPLEMMPSWSFSQMSFSSYPQIHRKLWSWMTVALRDGGVSEVKTVEGVCPRTVLEEAMRMWSQPLIPHIFTLFQNKLLAQKRTSREAAVWWKPSFKSCTTVTCLHKHLGMFSWATWKKNSSGTLYTTFQVWGTYHWDDKCFISAYVVFVCVFKVW